MIHVGSIVQATVNRIRDLTHDVRELGLRLRKPKDIAFKAGQFISFDLTPPRRRAAGNPSLFAGLAAR